MERTIETEFDYDMFLVKAKVEFGATMGDSDLPGGVLGLGPLVNELSVIHCGQNITHYILEDTLNDMGDEAIAHAREMLTDSPQEDPYE